MSGSLVEAGKPNRNEAGGELGVQQVDCCQVLVVVGCVAAAAASRRYYRSEFWLLG